jgi:hypothetical protein
MKAPSAQKSATARRIDHLGRRRPRRRPRWRRADEDLFGEGCEPPADIKARMDAAAYAEFYFDAMGDEGHPAGWWHVLIWKRV